MWIYTTDNIVFRRSEPIVVDFIGDLKIVLFAPVRLGELPRTLLGAQELPRKWVIGRH